MRIFKSNMLSCRKPCRLDHIGVFVAKNCGSCSSLFHFCFEVIHNSVLLLAHWLSRRKTGSAKSLLRRDFVKLRIIVEVEPGKLSKLW